MAQLVVAACDYVRNPWGDYNELNLGFLARPAGAPADVIGSFVYRMPVNQAFTCEAGNRVMGFPKTVEELDVAYADGAVTFRLAMGGDHVLTLGSPAPRRSGAPSPVERRQLLVPRRRAPTAPPVHGHGHRLRRPRRRRCSSSAPARWPTSCAGSACHAPPTWPRGAKASAPPSSSAAPCSPRRQGLGTCQPGVPRSSSSRPGAQAISQRLPSGSAT